MNELNINKKDNLNRGFDHVVFPFKGDDTKVIKTAYDRDANGKLILAPVDLDFWEQFMNNSSVCAKIFKISDKYVVMEKLNTDKVEKDEKVLANQLKSILPTSYTWLHNPEHIITHLYDMVHDNNIALIRQIESLLPQRGLFRGYISFFIKVDNVFGNEKLDIHGGQVGYDSKGNLKLLDY